MNRLLLVVSLACSVALALPAGAQDFEPGDSVWMQFGDPDQEHGLYWLDWGEESAPDVRGGRYCRQTDGALSFRVDPRWLHEPMPVKVVVEYWDEGTDWFLVRYNSTDGGGQHRGENMRTFEHYRTDTKTWKQAMFVLPDARFKGSAWDKDFNVGLDPWTGSNRQQVFVSRVEVIKGGVALSATPEAVSADGKTAATIQARVYDRSGDPAPDGTPVEFACTRGKIEPRIAATTGGRATAAFTGGLAPGPADVTATALGDTTRVDVPVLEGKGPIHEVTYVVDDFTHPERWRVAQNDDIEASLTLDKDTSFRGRPVARWHYRFKRPIGTITIHRKILFPGRVKRIWIWEDHDDSGAELNLICRDAAGQQMNWILPKMWGVGWRLDWQDLGWPWDHYNEPDFRVNWPITIDHINFGRYRNERDVGEMGVIHFQDLTATCLIPESSLVWPEVELEATLMEAPGRTMPCHVVVHNLSDQASADLRLEVAVTDRAGRKMLPSPPAFALAPGETKTFDCSFRPADYGRHEIEARVRGGPIDSVARQQLIVGLETD